jgi:hypothetical protein
LITARSAGIADGRSNPLRLPLGAEARPPRL